MHDLDTVISNLAGDDERRAEDAARWLSEHCDGTTGDKTTRRASVGQVRGIWPAFHKALMKSQCRGLRSATLDALGFVAFEDALNSAAIASNHELLNAMAQIIKTGSSDEKVAAVGTVANLTVSDDNMTSKICIAQHSALVTNLAEVFDPGCTSPADRLVQFRAVGAFNNIARSSEAAALLDSLGIPPVLNRFINSVLDEGDQEILVARTAMALAGLMGRLELNNLPRKGALLRLVVTCLEHAINRLEGGNGMFGNVLWSASVVLYPLYQLSIADANKVDLAEAGVVEQLLRLVEAWEEREGTRELEWSLLTLEQLSFHPLCRDRIRSALLPADADAAPPSALACLERVVEMDPKSELPKTRDTGGSIGQLVAGLLSNACPEMAPRAAEGGDEGGRQWVMISYNWDVQEAAREMCEGLQREGFVVWMDILDGCMDGDTLQAMATAVGHAAAVIVCVTSRYKESANCRREASYAHELGKPIVPVIMEPDYQPDGSWGWLGLIIAGKLYYDLSTPARFPSQLAALARAEELEPARRAPAAPPRSLRSYVKKLSGSNLSRTTTASTARTASTAVHESESWRVRRARAELAERGSSRSSSPQRREASPPAYQRALARAASPAPSRGARGSINSGVSAGFGILEEGSCCSAHSRGPEPPVPPPHAAVEAEAAGKSEALSGEVLDWLESLGRDVGRVNGWVFARHELRSLEQVALLTERDLRDDIEPLMPHVGHRVLLRQGLRTLRQHRKAAAAAAARRSRHVCNIHADPAQCPLM